MSYAISAVLLKDFLEMQVDCLVSAGTLRNLGRKVFDMIRDLLDIETSLDSKNVALMTQLI